jgi:hypothetical protein
VTGIPLVTSKQTAKTTASNQQESSGSPAGNQQVTGR